MIVDNSLWKAYNCYILSITAIFLVLLILVKNKYFYLIYTCLWRQILNLG